MTSDPSSDPDPRVDPEPERAIERAVDHVLDGAAGPSLPDPRPSGSRPGTPPWAEKLVRFLDDGLAVPGTGVRFGADGIIGLLLPGVGDVLTGTGSAALLLLALRERVPTVIVGRMVFNIMLDTLGGSLPIAGDLFDVLWKSNRKNLDLIERHRDDPDARPSAADYALVGAGLLMIAASIALPFVVFALLTGAGVLAFGSGD